MAMPTVTSESFEFLFEGAREPPTPPTHGDRSVLVSTDADGITTLAMNAPPVNLLTPAYLRYVNDWLRWLYHDPHTRGIILTSAVPNQFCAGGDLNECVAPTLEKTRSFWGEVQRAWLVLNAHRKPVVSFVTGTCPGGGCVMSMACDYRVMVRASGSPLLTSRASPTADGAERARTPPTAKAASSLAKPPHRVFKIGLNAPAFGICMPVLVSQMYRELLGLRRAELMLQQGHMVTADDAVEAGLIDVAVADTAAGTEAAHAYLRQVLTTPVDTRYQQKMHLRLPFIAPLATTEGREAEIEAFFHAINNDSTQTKLTAYLAFLHAKKTRQESPPHL